MSTIPPRPNGPADGHDDERHGGHFSLLLFASAETFTGVEALTLPAPMTIRELFDKLEQRFPGMQEKILNSCAVTINLDYVDLDSEKEAPAATHQPSTAPRHDDRSEGGLSVLIKNGDEVGIIPPVSSG